MKFLFFKLTVNPNKLLKNKLIKNFTKIIIKIFKNKLTDICDWVNIKSLQHNAEAHKTRVVLKKSCTKLVSVVKLNLFNNTK